MDTVKVVLTVYIYVKSEESSQVSNVTICVKAPKRAEEPEESRGKKLTQAEKNQKLIL